MAICLRRGELVSKAVSMAQAKGFSPVLLTFTLRHSAGEALLDLLEGLKGADRWANSGRWVHRWRDKWGFVGCATAAEVTHGRSGWHPHLHKLAFFDRELSVDDLNEMWAELTERWDAAVLKKLGPENEPDADYGVDVSRGDQAGWYLSKLGLEITSPHTKKGSDHNRGVWQIAADLAKTGSEQDAELWREYATAFHGKSHISWSRGRFDIKETLGLDGEGEESDSEAASEESEEAVVCSVVPDMIWDQCHAVDPLAGLRMIEAAERGGEPAVDDLIRRYLDRGRRSGISPPLC